jgi:hypothetical protein
VSGTPEVEITLEERKGSEWKLKDSAGKIGDEVSVTF